MTLIDTAITPLVQDAFRGAMGNVATPVSIVTTYEDGVPHGTTVSAFASLSMDPPMILVSLDRRSELLEIVRRTGTFGVNVLGAHQAAIGARFASKGVDRFADVLWSLDEDVPHLDGSASWVACRVEAIIDGGDHQIALGAVLNAQHEDVAPLTYHQRQFGTHTSHN